MTFIARIKQASPVWRRWHGERRVGGVLLGVQFAWEPGNVYRSLPLSTEQIAQLMTLDSIDFEAVSIDLPMPPVQLPVEPEEPEVEAVTLPEKTAIPEKSVRPPVYVNSRTMGRKS